MPTTQAIVEQFFAALHERDFAGCRAVLAWAASADRGDDPLQAAWCAYLAGIICYEADHDWAGAEAAFRRAAEAGGALGELLLRGRALLALGRSLDIQGRWGAARAAFAEAEEVFSRLGLPVEAAKALKHLAISVNNGFGQGDYGPDVLAQAIGYAERALEALDPLDQDDTTVAELSGTIWNTLGLIYRNTGALELAAACYEHDLAICRRLDDRRGMGLSYGNLGEIHQLRGPGSWPEALRAYTTALELIRAAAEPYEEAEALANLGSLRAAMGDHAAALAAFDAAITIIESLRAGVSAEEARTGFFSTVVSTYAHAVLEALELGDPARAFDYVERARARALLDLFAEVATPDQAAGTPLSLREIQAQMPPDAALLAYFTCGLVEAPDERPVAGVQRHRFPPPRTLLFGVTAERILAIDTGVDPVIFHSATLNQAAARYVQGGEMDTTLYRRLIAPAAELLRGARRIYLVPHGPLHYVPFQALTDTSGASLVRPGGPEVVYGLSASLLFGPVPPAPPTGRDRCLALGYNGAAANRLRYAEGEAASIAALTGGQAIVGPQPKAGALTATAGRWRWLHLSCHGAFDPHRPLASALYLADDETLTAQQILHGPMLHCDLVSLSACESGLSRIRRGDELMGFVRAFFFAGARTVLCSLWQVDELSTRILMERFYAELLADVPPPAALQRAQLFVRSLTHGQLQQIAGDYIGQALLPSLFEPSATRAAAPVPPAAVPPAAADDLAFADPFYWAAFVLVAGPGASLRDAG